MSEAEAVAEAMAAIARVKGLCARRLHRVDVVHTNDGVRLVPEGQSTTARTSAIAMLDETAQLLFALAQHPLVAQRT